MLCANRMQAKNNNDLNFHTISGKKVVALHIKIHYEKSKNMNFLVLIRSCVHYHGIIITSFLYYLLIVLIARRRL